MRFSYEVFSQILDRHLQEEQTERILEALADSPQRFTGIFRPSTPREKLIQYVVQSREIRFGDAFEEIIDTILRESGYTPLSKTLKSEGSRKLACDLLFKSPDGFSVLLVEQKMRDDHDSSKREGQFANFKLKIEAVRERYEDSNLHAVMYFVDPNQKKNQSYYTDKCNAVAASLNQSPSRSMTLSILYGEEFFSYIATHLSQLCVDWVTLTEWLRQWRNTVRSDALELIDLEKQENLYRVIEIASRRPELISKIARNHLLWAESLIKAVFPTGDGLRKICASLSVSSAKCKQAAYALEQSISKFYDNQEGTDGERATS